MIIDYSSISSDSVVLLDQLQSDAVVITFITQGPPQSTPAPTTYDLNKSLFMLQDSPAVTTNVVTKSSEVVDLKLRHQCNHLLSDNQYSKSSCPRCLGRGYYFDIKFNELGKVTVISKEDKLAQSLEKILITENNPFHPEYAKNLQKWLGALKFDEVKDLIKYDIVNAVGLLKAYQDNFPWTYSPRTMISTLDSIDVVEQGVDELQYIISITTVSGQQVLLKGQIVFADLYAASDEAEHYV